MTDLKTLILVIEQRISIAERNNQAFVDLPYDTVGDAFAMLKEQQQQIWELQDQVEYLTDKQKEQEAVYPSWQNGKMYCGHCGSKFPPRVGMRFCHRCGMPIKLKVNDIVEQEGR